MAIPKSFGELQGGLLPASTYWRCFDAAFQRMINLRPAGLTRWSLNASEHDSRTTSAEAAAHEFYPGFEYRDGKVSYTVTKAFFEASYRGFFEPDATRHSAERRRDFLSDCATNYLVKNLWHNHVHEQLQNITSYNYHEVGGEARDMADFEADNLATVILALSYGHVIDTGTSSLLDKPSAGLLELFSRNRCNNMFAIRENTRKRGRSKPEATIDELYEVEWLVRRRLANEVGMRCAMHGRALASISVHFFGELARPRRGRCERPNASGCVEMNGVRIPLQRLGNFAYSSKDEIKEAVASYAVYLDNEYAKHLRSSRSLKDYAGTSLQAKVQRLIDRPLTITKASGFRVAAARATHRKAIRLHAAG